MWKRALCFYQVHIEWRSIVVWGAGEDFVVTGGTFPGKFWSFLQMLVWQAQKLGASALTWGLDVGPRSPGNKQEQVCSLGKLQVLFSFLGLQFEAGFSRKRSAVGKPIRTLKAMVFKLPVCVLVKNWKISTTLCKTLKWHLKFLQNVNKYELCNLQLI